jgi:metal-responsive CopG/Arc/MetJ family transcriptional regulator
MPSESDDGDWNQVNEECVIISISLPLALKTRAESEISHVSADNRSELVRDALREYLDGDEYRTGHSTQSDD